MNSGSRIGRASRPDGRHFRILFLGQCTATGYGVTVARSYPQLVRQSLTARFPGVRFDVDVRPLLHPRGLAPLVKSILSRSPDVLFLSLPGLYASIPFRVNLLYLQAPDVMMAARSFLQRIEARLKTDSAFSRLLNKRSALRPTTVIPALSIAEYERCVSDAVALCQQDNRCRVILMGPGGFNEYSEDGNLASPELASAVNQMLLGVSQRMGVPFVNAYDLADDRLNDMYLPETHRWGVKGHEIMAREIEHLITSEIIQQQPRL